MTTTTAMPTVTRFTTKAGSTYEINRADYTFSKVVNGRLSNTMNIRTSDKVVIFFKCTISVITMYPVLRPRADKVIAFKQSDIIRHNLSEFRIFLLSILLDL